VLFAVQQLPWTLHVYILFPFFFWQDVTRKVHANWSAVRDSNFDAKRIASTLLGLFMAVAVLQNMVVRFSNTHLSPLWDPQRETCSLGTATELFGALASSLWVLSGL